MKILIISPPFGEQGQESKGLSIAPPVLEYLAGLTYQINPDVEVDLIDANIEKFNVDTVDADIVAFTVLTPQATWAYREAKVLRERGTKVVMGGIHASAMSEEVLQHADAIITGEAENVWAEFLSDAEKGKLKRVYAGGILANLEGLPRPRHGILRTKYRFGSFFTGRGCPHTCSFCSVHEFYGRKLRFRPVDEIVREVAESPYRMFWNIDDNIWAKVDRATELYKALASEVKGKTWFGSGDLVMVQQPGSEEMLKWARRAGMTTALVGWESENPDTLEELSATTKQGRERRDAVKRIRDHGIDVMLFLMLGSRKDNKDDFKRALDICDELNVMGHPVLTTPFPGTGLYDMYKDYMIPGAEWDSFNGNRALYTHDDPDMTPEAREQAVDWLRAEMFTWPRIIKRIRAIPRIGFPSVHITSFWIQYPQRRAFREVKHQNPFLGTK